MESIIISAIIGIFLSSCTPDEEVYYKFAYGEQVKVFWSSSSFYRLCSNEGVIVRYLNKDWGYEVRVECLPCG